MDGETTIAVAQFVGLAPKGQTFISRFLIISTFQFRKSLISLCLPWLHYLLASCGCKEKQEIGPLCFPHSFCPKNKSYKLLTPFFGFVSAKTTFRTLQPAFDPKAIRFSHTFSFGTCSATRSVLVGPRLTETPVGGSFDMSMSAIRHDLPSKPVPCSTSIDITGA